MIPNRIVPANTPAGRSDTKEDEPILSREYSAVREGSTEPMTINAIPKKAMPMQAAIYTNLLLYFIQFFISFRD
jgi:hypothetical protein